MQFKMNRKNIVSSDWQIKIVFNYTKNTNILLRFSYF